MPETNPAPIHAAEVGPPEPSEEAKARVNGLRRRSETPTARSQGLLPDALEELNATVEELRVAEEEMRAQNEELLLARVRVEAERHRYQDLFEFAPDGYLVTALDGKILEANRAASALLGIAPRFLKGRGLGTSVTSEDLPVYSAALQDVASSPAPSHPQEWAMRLRRRHAGLFHAAVTVAPVAALGDQPATLRWLVRDVTARKEAEAARLAAYERERRIAGTLQRLLLHTAPADAFPRLSVETFYQAGSDEAEIGGDFFDIFALGEGVVALVVGDVSGKGLAAATLTAEIKYALRVLLREVHRPALALSRLNDFVCEAQRLGDFSRDRPVALALATLDTQTGEAALAAAGGEPPLALRVGGAAETFGAGGLTLGIQSGVSYTEELTTLGAGDTLLMFTDGLTEARRNTAACQDGELLGSARLAEMAVAARHADTLHGMSQAVLDGARAWAGGALGDDTCLLLTRLE